MTGGFKKGFTLIELLVVIAIIGLLATLAVVSFGNARERARDTKRKGDLAQIAKALELFFQETGSYPPEHSPACNPDCSSCDTSCAAGAASTWDGGGLTRSILGHNISEFISVPVDPINDATYYYEYEPHCSLGSGRKGGFYVRVRLEETGAWHYVEGGVQHDDPDCLAKCPGAASTPCY